MNKKLLLLFTSLIIISISCSSGLYNQAKMEMNAGDYQAAITAYQDALTSNPDKAVLWRDLGVAFYRNSQYNEALDALNKAAVLAPEDGIVILYQGLAYERLGQDQNAAKLYRLYLADDPDEEIADRIRKRARFLSDKVVQQKVQDVITSEKTLSYEEIPENSIAVLGFSPGNLSPRYAPLARGLSELLTVDLSHVSDLNVLERVMLDAILKELEMSQTEYFDKEKAPRLGLLMGAEKVISGELSAPDKDQVKLESGIIEVKESFVDYPSDVEGDLSRFLDLEQELFYNIITSLGYTLTPEEEDSVKRRPTDSFLAFLSYSLGLEYADQGMYSLAEAQFDNALREDPDFKLAQKAKFEVQGLSDYNGDIEPSSDLEQRVFMMLALGVSTFGNERGLRDLQNTLGYQPDVAEDEGDNPYTEPAVGTGTINIDGNFDE